MADICLTLICTPALEEKLLDFLLVTADIQHFTSSPIAAHGTTHHALSATEQVLGRASMMRIEAFLDAQYLPGLQQQLAAQFNGTGLRYFVLPILEQGALA